MSITALGIWGGPGYFVTPDALGRPPTGQENALIAARAANDPELSHSSDTTIASNGSIWVC